MATITGVPGTQINATATVSNDGLPIDETESAATAQSFADDLATIKAGVYTTSATVTHTGADIFSDPVTFSIGETVTHNGTEIFNGITQMTDRLVFPGPAVELSDAAHSIDVTAATYYLHNNPASQRAITLRTDIGPPKVGERIRCVIPAMGSTTAIPYQFTRTGTPAGLLAAIKSTSVITRVAVSVEFEYGPGYVLTVNGAANNAGLIRMALVLPGQYTGSATDSLATGDQIVVSGAVTTGGMVLNGTWTITVIDGTHVDLQGSTFTGAWSSNGTAQITPGVWRLGMNSGTAYDGVASYGVLPDNAS